jgi:LmbE family N-acetylglucosaminyl deacetylase
MRHRKAVFMRSVGRSANRKRALAPALLVTLLSLAWVAGWPPGSKLDARPLGSLQAVTEQPTYAVGDEVWLKIIFPTPEDVHTLDSFLFTLRFAGEQKPLLEGAILGGDTRLGVPPTTVYGYRKLWKVPPGARTGRYEIDLRVQDPSSQQDIKDIPHISSFVVQRQVARITSVETGRSYYTSGDVMTCSMKVENLSDQPLQGLRVEFSERYWPWIAQQTERVGAGIETLQSEITLAPQQRLPLQFVRCGEAKGGSQPTIKQYAAVIWDHDRKNVYAISLSPLVFVNPPGVDAPKPYPGQYVYPSLGAVSTSSYRRFRAEPYGGEAIQFDASHTMFPAGAEAVMKFSLVNPTDTAWRQVSVRGRLVGPDEKELVNQLVAERVDLGPHGAPLAAEMKFALPPGTSGLFRARVDVSRASGQALATNTLELGVNPLPKSVLMFCAHEDDDGTEMGFIRAAVENHIPIHVVYITSGDAGACDRYYEHFCGPAEALNFGALRMEEARAALGHLGVPRENIIFLGLPDGGSGAIWYDHIPSSDPYLSVLLASDHAPYEGLFRPNLPYVRESTVEAIEEIIKKFQPEVICTVHPPAEGHIDHIVNNYFVVKAMQQLLREGAISPQVEVRVDRVFDPTSHPATPYHYEDHTFYVAGEVMALAQEAGWYYQSQGGNRAEGNLRTWNQLPRAEGYRKMLDWKEHEGWNEKR